MIWGPGGVQGAYSWGDGHMTVISSLSSSLSQHIRGKSLSREPASSKFVKEGVIRIGPIIFYPLFLLV